MNLSWERLGFLSDLAFSSRLEMLFFQQNKFLFSLNERVLKDCMRMFILEIVEGNGYVRRVSCAASKF